MNKVVVDLNQYTEAIKFISKKNQCFKDKNDEIKGILDGLIRDAAKENTQVSTIGLTVISHFIDDVTVEIDILVDPAICKDPIYINMTI